MNERKTINILQNNAAFNIEDFSEKVVPIKSFLRAVSFPPGKLLSNLYCLSLYVYWAFDRKKITLVIGQYKRKNILLDKSKSDTRK